MIKVFSQCVTLERTINAHHGVYSHQKYHDNQKTIFYDNALIKVYDIQSFIFQNYHIQILQLIEDQVFSPSFSDTKNLGSSVYSIFFCD